MPGSDLKTREKGRPGFSISVGVFEGDERYADIKILDVVSFLAQQINEKKESIGQTSVPVIETEA